MLYRKFLFLTFIALSLTNNKNAFCMRFISLEATREWVKEQKEAFKSPSKIKHKTIDDNNKAKDKNYCHTYFKYCKFIGNFENFNFKGCNFEDCDFEDVESFKNADFKKAQLLTNEQKKLLRDKNAINVPADTTERDILIKRLISAGIGITAIATIIYYAQTHQENYSTFEECLNNCTGETLKCLKSCTEYFQPNTD